jgi:hypothetical protein
VRVSARVGKHWLPEYNRAAIFRVLYGDRAERERASEREIELRRRERQEEGGREKEGKNDSARALRRGRRGETGHEVDPDFRAPRKTTIARAPADNLARDTDKGQRVSPLPRFRSSWWPSWCVRRVYPRQHCVTAARRVYARTQLRRQEGAGGGRGREGGGRGEGTSARWRPTARG